MTPLGTPSRSLYDFEARTVCPACESPDSTILFESGFDHGGIGTFVRTYYGVDTARLSRATYRLDQCAKCNLVYQHNVGSDELLRDLYTDWVENPQDPEAEIDTYRRDIRAPLLSRDAHEVIAAASYLGVPLQELRTLDFGMGWALWARIAAILGCQSYGSDLSQSRMDFARSHGVKAVDLEEIRYASVRFHQHRAGVRASDCAARYAPAPGPGTAHRWHLEDISADRTGPDVAHKASARRRVCGRLSGDRAGSTAGTCQSLLPAGNQGDGGRCRAGAGPA